MKRSLCNWRPSFHTRKTQPWVLMWFSGNMCAERMSGSSNLLLPVQSWYSPWIRDSTLFGCCQGGQSEGEEYGGGLGSSRSRLNGSHQPIAAQRLWLYSGRYPAPTQPSPSDIQAGDPGKWASWVWGDNEQWMSHVSRVGEPATPVGR